MAKKRILILGAGLAGLSAAWHLQRLGMDCQVFEKEAEVGGLCRSKNIGGFTFDYDGHLLHFRHRYTFNLIKNLLGNNLGEHKRSSWVYSYGRYIPYPFQANLYGLPPTIVKECLLGFIKALKKNRPVDKNALTFLGWINQTFGSGIARYFMIPYNEKFWTLPPQNLTCEWLDGFIPVPSLDQLIKGAVQESVETIGYNARFWYPKKGGIAQVPLAFSSKLKNVFVNSELTEINLKKREIKIGLQDKEKFDYLIYTLPLPEIRYLIRGLPSKIISLCNKLRWNSIFNLNLGIDRRGDLEKHWVYFPQKELTFFRVGFPHNFSVSLAPKGKNLLYTEASYSKNRAIDKNSITTLIQKDLEKVGILKKDQRIFIKDINDIKYGYPIYDKNYKFATETILQYLLQNNIVPCGRYGSWRYLSMEGSILDGKKVAETFVKNA